MYSPLYVIYQICINPHTQLLLLATSGEKQKFILKDELHFLNKKK